MCQIVSREKDGDTWGANVGSEFHLPKGGWVSPNKVPMKVKCYHPDGRSDTYLLSPGQQLVADEKAKVEIIEIYPKEIPAKPEPRKELQAV